MFEVSDGRGARPVGGCEPDPTRAWLDAKVEALDVVEANGRHAAVLGSGDFDAELDVGLAGGEGDDGEPGVVERNVRATLNEVIVEPPGDDRIGGSTVDEEVEATGVDQWRRITAPGVMKEREESAARNQRGVMRGVAGGRRETAAEERMCRIAALGHRRVTPA